MFCVARESTTLVALLFFITTKYKCLNSGIAQQEIKEQPNNEKISQTKGEFMKWGEKVPGAALCTANLGVRGRGPKPCCRSSGDERGEVGIIIGILFTLC